MRKRTPQPDDVKLSPSVPKSVWLALKARATEENRSVNDLLNEWIREKLGLPAEPNTPDSGSKGGACFA